MSKSPVTLAEPIIGKVISSTRKSNSSTSFVIEEGSYQDHVFVRAGEKQKGEDALIDILKNQLDAYVKICDSYVSPDTPLRADRERQRGSQDLPAAFAL